MCGLRHRRRATQPEYRWPLLRRRSARVVRESKLRTSRRALLKPDPMDPGITIRDRRKWRQDGWGGSSRVHQTKKRCPTRRWPSGLSALTPAGNHTINAAAPSRGNQTPSTPRISQPRTTRNRLSSQPRGWPLEWHISPAPQTVIHSPQLDIEEASRKRVNLSIQAGP